MARIINSYCKKKIGLLLHNGAKADYGWNPVDVLRWLLILP
jgi:hypothetical protein